MPKNIDPSKSDEKSNEAHTQALKKKKSMLKVFEHGQFMPERETAAAQDLYTRVSNGSMSEDSLIDFQNDSMKPAAGR
ncbi:hypothetical protein CC99x_006040 [Candidatus Berkiella cookevillensis]|uniref:Antitoxin VbhA domain-containing protein n=1 Tax=Candidatus Berkiella cookevillensis TaxID=437022 RepID=A0A0Q9YH70_9GAMM|nr:hypothetical protein [Candidatus Berkiella cookevillensis]MCS5708465.1 hypothetical protein [Candidatus Berkiella cookevillensis]